MSENEQEYHNGNNETPEIIIDISSDGLQAYVTVRAGAYSCEISSEAVRSALKSKGISAGINEEALAGLHGSVETGKKILIAEGIKPENGRDGEVELKIESGLPVPVRKGDKIAKIVKPGPGVTGKKVTNEPIPPSPGNEVKFPHTTNVFWNDIEPDILLAGVDGYCTADQTQIDITPFFDLEISNDGYKAWIVVNEPHDENDFVAHDLFEFLKANTITYGILEREIDRIFTEKIFEQKILIAEGKPLENGKDGSLRFYFDTVIEPKLDEKGNVDYKQLNLIQNVRKGDRLVEVIKPVDGAKGITVTGKEIEPKPGKEAARPTGKNASPDPSNPNILLAVTDGHVVKKGNTVEVIPLLHVKNVDFSTGNIEFIGSITIDGDVRSGFSVKAQSDIEVNGFVEDALIEAGGDVMLKTGFGGKGDGKITAHGKIIAQFCENQHIICEKDMIFCEYLMHSTIETKGKLVVTERKGLIVGGDIYAQNGVEAKIIGNKFYTPTKIHVGTNKEIFEQLRSIQEQLYAAEEKLRTVEKAQHLLLTKKLIKKKLDDKQRNLLKKLYTAKNRIGQEVVSLKDKIKKIWDENEKYRSAVVKIHDAVYPKTFITIFDKHLQVEEAFKNICFKYSPSGIQAVDLSEVDDSGKQKTAQTEEKPPAENE